jgi:hypothetical protein
VNDPTRGARASLTVEGHGFSPAPAAQAAE